MTLADIAKEMDNDKEEMWWKTLHLLEREKDSRAVKMLKKFPYYYLREMVSSRKNRYIIRLGIMTKKSRLMRKDDEKNNMDLATYLEHIVPGHGHYLYQRSGNGLLEIQPHFFHRYMERTGFAGSSNEAVRRYLKNNPKPWETRALFEGVEHVAVAVREGIGLGVREGNFTRMKTFVTFDLLFPEQVEYQEYMVECMDAIHNYAIGYTAERGEKILTLAAEFPMKMKEICTALWRNYASYSLKKKVHVHLPLGNSRTYELREME